MPHLRLLPILILLAISLHAPAAPPVAPTSAPAVKPIPATRPVATQPAKTLDYQIARWPRGAQAALTLTFDDGTENLFTKTEPQLTAAKIPGTFYLITGAVGTPKYATWDQVRTAAAHGHEIGSHTLSHGYAEGPVEALQKSRAKIDAEVPAQRCLTIGYPFGKYAKEAPDFYLAGRLAGKHFIYADHPANLLRLEDYLLGTPKPEDMTTLADAVLEKQGWSIVTFHYPGDNFDQALAALQPYRDRIAILPLADLARYIREARAARLELLSRDVDTLALQLTADLSKDIYTQPLTLILPRPAGWSACSATQSNKPLWHDLRDDLLLLEATPNAGPITLQRTQP